MGTASLPVIDTLAALRARPLAGPERAKSLSLGLAPLEALLPDGGLPSGAVVELAAHGGLGQLTRVALSACATAQQQVEGPGERPWCAWVDTSATLFAPGACSAGVDLDRLLVVRPPARAVGRVAVRLVASRVFSLIIVDRSSVPGAEPAVAFRTRWSTVVRRLALALEGTESTVVLLSTLPQARAQALPVAMRLELSRPASDRWSVRISKDRFGRIMGPQVIELESVRADAS